MVMIKLILIGLKHYKHMKTKSQIKWDAITEYCDKHHIDVTIDMINCFCISFWNDKISNYKNCIRFKKWCKEIIMEWNT